MLLTGSHVSCPGQPRHATLYSIEVPPGGTRESTIASITYISATSATSSVFQLGLGLELGLGLGLGLGLARA
jgi:hypothetical protein